MYGRPPCMSSVKGKAQDSLARSGERAFGLIGSSAYTQAGGGIVADFVPKLEYQESLNKAKAVMRAIERAREM